jgi:PhnB protein
MTIQPYLFFEGRAEEALNFYKQALGAKEVMLMRYKDSPEAPPPGMVPPGSENKVMHMSFTVGDSLINGSDGGCTGQGSFAGFSLSYQAKDAADAARAFKALSAGGTVRMPLGKTFFSPMFGMLADKFGLGWMVIVPQEM